MSDQDLRNRLQQALLPAMRARDAAAVSAIRSALAAVANAEAVPVQRPSASLGDGPVAGAVGVGAAEAPRRELVDGEVRALVEAEVAERRQAADQLTSAGRADAADRLHAEADALLRHL
ncbi:hypothetical protein GCM10027517_16610 [Phycicoccus ginsengisoli]